MAIYLRSFGGIGGNVVTQRNELRMACLPDGTYIPNVHDDVLPDLSCDLRELTSHIVVVPDTSLVFKSVNRYQQIIE
eukprot:2874903-Amphidinium_carterae.1